MTTSSPKNFDYVKSSGADVVFDYKDADKCVADVRNFTRGRVRRAWDCVSTPETATVCAKVLSSDGGEESRYSSLIPVEPEVLTSVNPNIQSGFTVAYTAFGEQFGKWGRVNEARPEDYDFAKTFFEIARGLLEEGKLKPVRQLVNHGGQGLDGIIKGLDELKAGKVSAAKLVYTL